jgi:hypothetical protein
MSAQIAASLARALAALAVAVALLGSAAAPTPAKAGADVSIEYFHESLEPQGRWVDHYKHGRVWYPVNVDDDWRPYTRGRWVNTADYGWYWESSEPWGWATYHYGRWDFDDDYGWVWVPGREWGPAWVDWRHGDGYVGWAPLPPAVVWRERAFDYGGVDIVSVRYRPTWCFVQESRFISGDVYRHVLPPARNVTIINRTTNITNYTVVNNTFVNNSVNVTRIETATRTKIVPVRVALAAAPVVAAGRAKDQVAVFKPQILPGIKAPPPAKAPTNPAVPAVAAKAQPQTAVSQPPPSQPVPAAKAAEKPVPVLPKGGMAQDKANRSDADAKRAKELERRQAAEAAKQSRGHIVERITQPLQPREAVRSRQAAEKQELQRIQDTRRAVANNRAAIAQRAAPPQAKPQPAAQKGPPPRQGQKPPEGAPR